MVEPETLRREAKLWLDRHGAKAVPIARGVVAIMQAEGDAIEADRWLQLIAAVEELQRAD
jgi:hypothetical protein